MKLSSTIMMLQCPGCRTQLQAQLEDAGDPCQCPVCGLGFYLPAPPAKKAMPTTHAGYAPSAAPPVYSTVPRPSTSPPLRPRRRSAPPVIHVPPAVKKTHPGLLEKVMGAVITAGVIGFGYLWFSQRDGDPTPATMARAVEPAASVAAPASPAAPMPAAPSSAMLPGGFPARHIAAEAVRPDGRRVFAGLSDRRAHIPQTARRTHSLLDARGLQNFAYLAEVDPEGQVLWLSVFGGDLLKPTHLVLTRDGGMVVAGVALERFQRVSRPGADGVVPNGPVLVKLRPDGSTVAWIRSAGPGVRRVRSLHEDRQGNIVWTSVRETGPEAPTLHRLDANGMEIASTL